MRIENNRAIQFYQRTKAATTVKKEESGSALSSAKTDHVSISAEAVRKYELESAGQNIALDVENEASASRLQQLSAQIEAGEYRIPTESLADAILGRI